MFGHSRVGALGAAVAPPGALEGAQLPVRRHGERVGGREAGREGQGLTDVLKKTERTPESLGSFSAALPDEAIGGWLMSLFLLTQIYIDSGYVRRTGTCYIAVSIG